MKRDARVISVNALSRKLIAQLCALGGCEQAKRDASRAAQVLKPDNRGPRRRQCSAEQGLMRGRRKPRHELRAGGATTLPLGLSFPVTCISNGL